MKTIYFKNAHGDKFKVVVVAFMDHDRIVRLKIINKRIRKV